MARSQLQQAMQHMQAGRLARAEQACRALLHANPRNIQAQRLLGQITRDIGKPEESVRLFQQLHQARPNDLQLLGELGASLTAANQQARALPLLQRAVESMPSAVQWKIWLGKCLLKLFRLPAAIEVLERARAEHDDPEVLLHLANTLSTAGRAAPAERVLREYLKHNPDSIPGLNSLASTLEHQNRLDDAADIARRVLVLNAGNDAARGMIARALRAYGQYDEALATLKPVIEQEPTPERASILAPIYLATKRFDHCKRLIESLLESHNLPNPTKASMVFALAEAHLGLGDHENAFLTFQRANSLYPASFNRDRFEQRYAQIHNVFAPDTLNNAADAKLDARRCVFIVGMPRSGTSLIEQILDAVPRAHGCGELTELPLIIDDLTKQQNAKAPACLSNLSQDQLTRAGQRYLDHLTTHDTDADLLIDKLPHNFEHLGLIHKMLPGAHIIHCQRNPIDTCLSCFFTPLSTWHAYSNDLANLGFAYAQYTDLMRHWRDTCSLPMLEVQYESLVADIETQARRILEFVGLPWDDRYLRFYDSKRTVTTASVEQVRQPIYTTSVARWKRYEKHLAPLIDALREAGVDIPDTISPDPI